MTDIVEKTFVTLAVLVFAFAFGCQGLHSYRMPPAQAQTDFGPDTATEGPDDLTGTWTTPDVSRSIHRADGEAQTGWL